MNQGIKTLQIHKVPPDGFPDSSSTHIGQLLRLINVFDDFEKPLAVDRHAVAPQYLTWC